MNEFARKLADSTVSDLRWAIHRGDESLEDIPRRVVIIVDNGIWRERLMDHSGELACFETFREFVETLPLEGLGTTVKTLQNLCRDHPEALDAIDRAMETGRGGDNNPNGRNQYSEGKEVNAYNISNSSPPRNHQHGTSSSSAMRKLRSDRPDLHERVLNGELSAHAAMVEAGFRKKIFTISENLEEAARTLSKHFDPDELYQAMKIRRERREDGPYNRK